MCVCVWACTGVCVHVCMCVLSVRSRCLSEQKLNAASVSAANSLEICRDRGDCVWGPGLTWSYHHCGPQFCHHMTRLPEATQLSAAEVYEKENRLNEFQTFSSAECPHPHGGCGVTMPSMCSVNRIPIWSPPLHWAKLHWLQGQRLHENWNLEAASLGTSDIGVTAAWSPLAQDMLNTWCPVRCSEEDDLDPEGLCAKEERLKSQR